MGRGIYQPMVNVPDKIREVAEEIDGPDWAVNGLLDIALQLEEGIYDEDDAQFELNDFIGSTEDEIDMEYRKKLEKIRKEYL